AVARVDHLGGRAALDDGADLQAGAAVDVEAYHRAVGVDAALAGIGGFERRGDVVLPFVLLAGLPEDRAAAARVAIVAGEVVLAVPALGLADQRRAVLLDLLGIAADLHLPFGEVAVDVGDVGEAGDPLAVAADRARLGRAAVAEVERGVVAVQRAV